MVLHIKGQGGGYTSIVGEKPSTEPDISEPREKREREKRKKKAKAVKAVK